MAIAQADHWFNGGRAYSDNDNICFSRAGGHRFVKPDSSGSKIKWGE
jgi:hypothetical protein